jgi:hypothetical protein
MSSALTDNRASRNSPRRLDELNHHETRDRSLYRCQQPCSFANLVRSKLCRNARHEGTADYVTGCTSRDGYTGSTRCKQTRSQHAGGQR